MSKSKGTIFYIHGNSSSSRVFQNIIDSNRISFNQIAFDLPGHGGLATSEDSSDFSTKTYCDFLISKVKEIDDDILLVGNSLGGHLVLEIAPYLERLKGLVIFGTPPVKKPINPDEAFNPVPALQIFLDEKFDEDELAKALKEVVYDNNLIPNMIKDFKIANPMVRSSLLNDLQLGNWSDQAQTFTELNLAKFLLIGSHDVSVNNNYLMDLAKKSVNPVEIFPLENCGHYASIEKPLEFEKIILEITGKVFK